MFVLSFIKLRVGTALSADWLRPFALNNTVDLLMIFVNRLGDVGPLQIAMPADSTNRRFDAETIERLFSAHENGLLDESGRGNDFFAKVILAEDDQVVCDRIHDRDDSVF